MRASNIAIVSVVMCLGLATADLFGADWGDYYGQSSYGLGYGQGNGQGYGQGYGQYGYNSLGENAYRNAPQFVPATQPKTKAKKEKFTPFIFFVLLLPFILGITGTSISTTGDNDK